MRVELQLQGQSRPKCRTQRDLCFRPISETEIKSPVFPLYFHPHKFFCAQIPGVGLDETHLFDGIEKSNEDVRLFILDILSFAREYANSINILRTQVITLAKDDFPILARDYLSSLDAVQTSLAGYLERIEGILKNPKAPDFIPSIVVAITNCREMRKTFNSCYEQLEKVDGPAKEASIKFSPEFSEVLDGKTIYQTMSSVATFALGLGDLSKGLAKTLPKVDYKKEIMMLLAFSQTVENATLSES